MNNKLYISRTIILLLLFVAVAQAQNTALPKKIAFVNDGSFDDKKGIVKLFAAYNRLGTLDCFPTPMQTGNAE